MSVFDRHLMAKVESSRGVDAVPTAAANSIRVTSLNVSKTQNNVQRTVVKQTMGDITHLVDPDASTTVEATVELKGSGAAGTAPECGVLFLACRMLEAIVGATSVTYNPSTGTEKTITLYVYKDGLLWKVLGAVGNVVINMEMGAPVSATFTFQGAYVAPTVTAIPGSISFQSTLPKVASSADVVNDGSVVKVGSFSIDAGNDVQPHRVTGENTFVVANRAPTVTFSKDSVSTAVEWTALAVGTEAALSNTIGAAAGNIVTITAPVGKRTGVTYGERADRDTLEVSYNLYESTSDDQFAIAFT